MKKLVLILFLLFGCSTGGDDTIHSLQDRGDIAFSRREYSQAVNHWKRAYAKNKNDLHLIQKLGDGYLKIGRLERAILFFEAAVKIAPDNLEIQLKLAQLYILKWDLPRAENIYNYFAQKNVFNSELYLLKADISLMSDQTKEAEQYYRKAVIGSKDSFRALMKLAIFLKSNHKEKESKEILDIVKKNSVESANIFLLLSDYYLIDSQYKLAEKYINHAINAEPEDIQLKYKLIQLYVAIGSLDRAEQLVKQVLLLQNDIYLKMLLADILILNTRLKDAEKIITDLKSEISEDLLEFELLQGKFWLFSGKPVYATSHLKSAVQLRPGAINTRYLLGLTHLINNKVKLSEMNLINALQLNPKHHRSLLLMAQLLYKRAEYNLSQEYLKRLLKRFPEDFSAHILSGLSYLHEKDYENAKTAFKQSMVLDSDSLVSYYYLGIVEELSGNTENALRNYEQALRKNNDLIDVSYRYCMLLLKSKKIKIVKKYVEKLLDQSAKSPEKYYLAAKVAIKTGNRSMGEQFFEKALELKQVPGFIYLDVSNYYASIKNIKKSITVLTECTKKNPSFPDAWISLARIHYRQFDSVQALETLRAGIKKFPDSPIFQSNFAWFLLENDEDESQALDLAQSAYEKRPDNVAIADTLGWAYYRKGIYSQSIWILVDAQKKAPDNGFIKYHLGMAYFKQGEFEKSIDYLTQASASKESKYFYKQVNTALIDLENHKNSDHKTEKSPTENSLLAPPEIDSHKEKLILPDWQH